MEKTCRILENLQKNFFLVEKNPTSSSKIGGILGKKVSLFFVFLEIKFWWKKFAVFWKICEKIFFSGKKSNFKFENRGYFEKKKLKSH